MAKLRILEPAQRELEEIAQLHLNLVGANSVRNITNLILDTLSWLELFPLSGHIPRDKKLRGTGCRYVIADKYICAYRIITERVFVNHIAHGASNYLDLFKRLFKEENISMENIFPNGTVGGRLFQGTAGPYRRKQPYR